MSDFLPPSIAFLLGNIEDFKAKMAEAEGISEETDSKIGKLGKLGAMAFLAVGAAVVGVGVEAVKLASQFDATMARINTQDNAQLTIKQMTDLKSSVLSLAGPTAQAPDALAEAMIHVYGSGLKGAAALSLLKVAAEGATVGHADLVDVTNALDAAVAVGIKGTGDYSKAMGELNATVGAGDMTMQNLADALGGPMLATVKSYGLNLTDVGAALAVFGDRNIRGADAATMLRLAAQSLAQPAANGAKALKSIGLNMDSLNKDLQKGGLQLALNDLNDHLKAVGLNSTNSGQLLTQAFGKKAGGGVSVLLDSLASSTSNFNDKFTLIAKTGSTFSADWAQTQDTLQFKIKSLGATAEALGVKVGEALTPKIKDFLDLVSSKGIPNLEKFGKSVVAALDSSAAHQAEDVLKQVWKDALITFQDVTASVENLQRALGPTEAFLAEAFLGTLREVGHVMADDIAPAVKAATGFLSQHATVIKYLSEVVLAGLLLRLAYLKALAAIDMFTNFVNGIGKAITAVIDFGKAVASGQIFDTIRLKSMYAADAVRGLAGAETEAGAAAEAAAGEQKVGGLMSKLAGSLPIIGGVLLGVGFLADKLGQLSGVGDKLTYSITQLNTAMLGISTEGPQAQQSMANMGIALGKANQVSGMAADNLKGYDQSLAQLVSSGHVADAAAIIDKIRAATDAHGNALINAARDFPQYYAALDTAANSAKLQATAADASTASVQGEIAAMNNATGATQGLSDATSNLTDTTAGFASQLSNQQAIDTFNSDLLNLTQSVQNNGRALDANSTAGLANRQAISQAAGQIAAYYQQQVTASGPSGIPAATKTMNDQINALETTAVKVYGSKTAVDAYLKSLGAIPVAIPTTVTVNTSAALLSVAQLSGKLANLGGGVTVTPTVSSGSGGAKAQTHAAGGPVSGDGDGTSDSILSWLSNGEWVISAAGASRFPPRLLSAMNAGDVATAAGLLASMTPAAANAGTGYLSGPSGASGGGDVAVTVYVQTPGAPGWKQAQVNRKEVLRYARNNSKNNLSLTGAGG